MSALLGTAVLVNACAAQESGVEGRVRAGGGGAGGVSNQAGTSSSQAASGGASELADSGTPPVSDSGFGGQCSGTTSNGAPAPLDIYFIVDMSGSMLEEVSTGVSKWNAVHQAITDFVNDPASSALGVGIQYFPTSCGSHSDCENGGPCGITSCAGSGQNVTDPCVTSADCSGADGCYFLGTCSTDNGLCVPAGATNIPNCGTCRAMTRGVCWDSSDCNIARYSTPAVAIAPLSGNKQNILTSIDAVQPPSVFPGQNTPTPSALEGALVYARAYAQSHPSHTVVTVLATDGYPTECLALGTVTLNDAIQQVADRAAAGFSGTPSIRTYVIGVFPPSDTNAPIALDIIARAGKTDHAYVASATTSLTDEFRAALDSIRGRVFSCDYAVPPAPSGQTLDYGKVNVVFSAGDSAQRLYYVRNATLCDSVSEGGWYYDVDPASGTPSKIILCSQNCTTAQGTADGSLDIELGCQTVEAPIH